LIGHGKDIYDRAVASGIGANIVIDRSCQLDNEKKD